MKHVLFIALLAGFTCMSCSDFKYKTEDGGIIITGYNGDETEVIIPEKIDDLPVKTIGEHTFADKGLTSVVIPDNVTSIGDGAFVGNKLTTIVIGNLEYQNDSGLDADIVFAQNINFFKYKIENSTITITDYLGDKTDIIIPRKINNIPVTHIGDRAFSHNILISIGDGVFREHKLTSVVIPDTVVSIGKSTFYNNNLTSVTISSNAAHIGEYAFAGNEVTALIVDGIAYSYNDDWEVFYQYINDFAYTIKDNSITIIGYFGNRKDVIIPAAINGLPVTHIRNWAFFWKGLTSIIIPNTVVSIGECAFGDNSLTSVSIPESVTHIGNRAFDRNNLTNVVVPDTVEVLGENVFLYNSRKGSKSGVPAQQVAAEDEFSTMAYKNEITIIRYIGDKTDIIIPERIHNLPVTHIGDEAFYDKNLTSIIIPEGVISIGSRAFSSNNLTSTIIPNSITSMEDDAFLAQTVSAEHEFSTIAYKNEITITRYNGNEKNVVIPSQINSLPVTHIGHSAFSYSNLTSIIIPETVKTIGHSAFSDNNLTSVVIPKGVKTIGIRAFENNDLTSVIIPESVASIEHNAFAYNNLTSVLVPDTVVSIGGSVFAGNNLRDPQLPAQQVPEKTVSANPEFSILIHKNEVTIIGYNWYKTDVVIPVKISGLPVTRIGDYVFANNNLTSIVIPDSVTSIGWEALTGVDPANAVIPDSVENFDGYAVFHIHDR